VLGTVKNDDFKFTNFAPLNNIRTENSNGIKSENCNRCWKAEDNDMYSKRQSAIDFYKDVPFNSDTVELNSLEFNVNWACNLACIMCSPEYSSTWAQELKYSQTKIDIQNKKFHTQNTILSKLDLSNIKRVHFNGGEPLINDEHCNVLEQIKLSDCKITYNSNGTKFPSKRALELWKQSKMVRVFFSIDATGSPYEYIRWNAGWKHTQNVIKRFMNETPSNVMFGLNVTVGSYNLLEICDLWKWFQDNLATNREGDPSDFNWQTAYNFNHKYVIQDVKDTALNELVKINELTSLYNSIQSDYSVIPSNDWINELNTIDKRRRTNWRTSLKIGKFY
jgi:MoaA/NifB/PqqE/SkfB family radical SAM enzyme